jgi:hypothetical protein
MIFATGKTRAFVFCSCIFAVSAGHAFAAGPYISSVTVNGVSQYAAFNPNNGEKVTIVITTNTPVKFNTIAICANSDDVCSRTTAVKYFTQTGSYANSVSKDWDGKTGGSSPIIVPEGEYVIKATLADQSGNTSTEMGAYTISVDFSRSDSSSSDLGSGASAPPASSTSSNPASPPSGAAANASAGSGNRIISISTHADPEDLSDFSEKSSFTLSAGRERLAYVGEPVAFKAAYALPQNETNAAVFTWSYGDGFEAAGEEVSHIYRYPGEYNVVLHGNDISEHAIARTKVTVLLPHVNLSRNADGGVQLANLGSAEINLGGWKIAGGSGTFIFPKDTIIDSGKNLPIAPEDIRGGDATGMPVSLQSPNGKTVASLQENLSSSLALSTSTMLEANLGMSIAEAEHIVSAYRQSLDYAQPKNIEPASDEVAGSSSSYTASVESSLESTTTKGFWHALFDIPVRGLKAIGSLFYDF